MRMFHKAASVAALAICGACATEKPLYTWDNYEETVYSSYNGKKSPVDAIGKLEKDAARFSTSLKGAPPGYHAHLGFLYHQVGDVRKAHENFELERSKYPDSAKLMNRLLNPALNKKQSAKKAGKS